MNRFACLVIISLVTLTWNASLIFAEEMKADYTGTDYTQNFKIAKQFQSALHDEDKKTIAHLIRYPIDMEYPVADIETPEEFLANWDDFFDKENIAILLKDKPENVGDKGLLLDSGRVWIQGEKVLVGSLRSSKFTQKFNDAKAKEELTLHANVRGYNKVLVRCDTPSKTIRIQEHNDGVRYFVWKKSQPLTEKPELDLKGEYEFQGTMGGTTYTFKNEDYSYVFASPNLCEEECHDSLAVYKGEAELSRQICK